jgi:hypothetical protein
LLDNLSILSKYFLKINIKINVVKYT